MRVILFEVSAQAFGAFPQAHDQDVAFHAEAATDGGNQVARGQPETEQKQPAGEDETGQEDSADTGLLGAEGAEDDEQYRGQGAVDGLAEGVAKDDGGAGGVEFSVNVEAVAGGGPDEGGEDGEEVADVGEEVELQVQLERLAETVGQAEGGGGENDVG